MNRMSIKLGNYAIGRRRAAGWRRGAAIIELALALPILLSVLLLAIDYGRLAFIYIAVTNAARAGAGYASTNAYPPTSSLQTTWTNNAKSAATGEFSGNMGYNSANLTVSVSAPASDKTNYYYVSVTASYPFQTLINWRLFSGYHTSVSISRTVVMRVTV